MFKLDDALAAAKGKIRGQYYAHIKKQDGTQITTEVAPNWVEKHFTKEAISIVQRVAMELKETHELENGSSVQYYTDISREEFGTFQDMEVGKIRYLPERVKIDKEGNEVILEEMFKGLVKTPEGKWRRVILPLEWMEENTSKKRLQWIKKNCAGHGFVDIPEGANNQNTDLIQNKNLPLTKYRQSDLHGSRACVTFSAASALHHVGFPVFAKNLANKFITSPNYHMIQYKYIMDMYYMNDCIDIGLRRKIYFIKIKNPKKNGIHLQIQRKIFCRLLLLYPVMVSWIMLLPLLGI